MKKEHIPAPPVCVKEASNKPTAERSFSMRSAPWTRSVRSLCCGYWKQKLFVESEVKRKFPLTFELSLRPTKTSKRPLRRIDFVKISTIDLTFFAFTYPRYGKDQGGYKCLATISWLSFARSTTRISGSSLPKRSGPLRVIPGPATSASLR